ncbi:hypothetical protein PC129_g17990 [Phytophthora cactorum]|uniref:Uncharacterized protein n=1 Tax=Phytophthora cactorum TaxID=29920 RepID=A0A8T1HGF3_9STRA|nr:hypothetical protein PC120_g20549 [Phytophthora cactorum]KAG3135427.1 hypothetical protein C6341_g21773 [Phytophthora cactorum]KAG3196803.1 hypothetical protein PC128_g7361 [Phytophthora cactorum]KAG3211026.1 hypothetical protein PC129_g17990 [Phytophthora cactorum]
MKVPLVGCASHRLNLAVRDFLGPHEAALDQVQLLVRKLRTLNQAAKLRIKTSLVPVLRPDMRWSSTFSMLERYFRQREFCQQTMMTLHYVESISKKLQSDGLTLLDARDLFDGLLGLLPTFSNYLAPDADIVHSPVVEAAVVKDLAGEATSLTAEKASELEPFTVKVGALSSSEVVSSAVKEGFADRILQSLRGPGDVQAPSTPNIVERLFSVTRGVLRHERHRLSPMTLEMIFFSESQ